MKQLFKRFMASDVSQANSDLIVRKDRLPAGLSPAATRLLRQSKFSSDEINRAFAEAVRVVAKR
jgi:hypothetical protein